MDGLGDDSVNCFLVYFFENKPRPHQNRHQSTEEGERREANILDDFNLISYGKESQ